MRLRKNPKARPTLAEHPNVFQLEDLETQNWRKKLTQPNQPFYVELGTGKGQFITTCAEMYPSINWIGVERIPEALYQAVKKGFSAEKQNLIYIWADIEQLSQFFHEKEVTRFYLHFSDPWPKKRHQKRRLTHRRFLEVYKNLLTPSGDLILKTDSSLLYEFTQEELEASHWKIVQRTEDFHPSLYIGANIRTEYEEKFSSRGQPIYYLRAIPS